MAHVKIYTRRGCGYCTAAEDLLRRKGVAYEREDVGFGGPRRQWLREASGRSTVPQVFINGRPIGGYTDLRALDERGELDRLLSERPAAA